VKAIVAVFTVRSRHVEPPGAGARMQGAHIRASPIRSQRAAIAELPGPRERSARQQGGRGLAHRGHIPIRILILILVPRGATHTS